MELLGLLRMEKTTNESAKEKMDYISSMEKNLRQMEKSSVIFQSLLIEKSFRVF